MDDTWWQLIIIQSDYSQISWDELGYQLIEIGASGSEQVDNTFKAYFLEPFDEQEIKSLLSSLQISKYELQKVPNENWVAKCKELFQPVQIKDIIIEPVFEYQERAKKEGQIYIIPGMGFGSGHHETSQMLGEMMQELPISRNQNLSILDFGAGSGILSLIACEVFKNAEILAVDNDHQAILNAKDNLTINNCTEQVLLSEEDISSLSNQFDLIFANIYLEVLRNYQSDLKRLLKPEGHLLVSGLTSDQDRSFKESFSNWNYLDTKINGNWNAYLLANRN